jgi:RHS repeat-associated protein
LTHRQRFLPGAFHTGLGQSMGLNHMKGRVQDAMLGRLISPDSYVPDPTNAQSYNRYSYVNNNPLTLIDPSGFDDENIPLPSGSGGGAGGGWRRRGRRIGTGRSDRAVEPRSTPTFFWLLSWAAF